MTEYFKPTLRNALGWLACLAIAFGGQIFFSQGISNRFHYIFKLAPVLTGAGLWLFIGAAIDVRREKFKKIFKITKARVIESLLYALIFPFLYLGVMPATLLFFLPLQILLIFEYSGNFTEAGLKAGLMSLIYFGVALIHFVVLSVFKTKWKGKEQAPKRRIATLMFLLCAATFSMTFVGLNPFSL